MKQPFELAPAAFFLPAAAGLLLAAACRAVDLPVSTAAEVTASAEPEPEIFTLGPGDLLFVSVLGQPEILLPEGGLRVSPDGTISLPLVGAVTADGKSVEDLRLAIEAGYAEFYQEPAVMVSLLEYGSRRFHLLGEVRKPGSYAMDRPLTGLEALSLGGGFEPGANRRQVVVVRRHAEAEIEVIAFDALTPGPDGLVQVRPGDLLFVPRAGVGVFTESVMPYLQALGFSLSQIAAVVIAYDRVQD